VPQATKSMLAMSKQKRICRDRRFIFFLQVYIWFFRFGFRCSMT
jgi:hypothetical protein